MWFWFSLASAILGAVDLTLSKQALKKVSPVLQFWAINAFTLPVLLVLVLKNGIPNLNITFWVAVISSSLTWAVGRSMFNWGLKNHLLSQIIPLTSFTVIFTYFFGLLFLHETLSLISILGLVAVIIGSYILNADQAKEDILKPFKIIFGNPVSVIFLLALLITSITPVLDKISLQNTFPTNLIFVIFLENIMETLMTTPYLLTREKNNWLKQLKANLGILLINSLVMLVIVYVVFAAYIFGNGPVALVLGIKRLQIILALLLGYLFLGDKPAKHTWIASLIMIAGTLMIKSG